VVSGVPSAFFFRFFSFFLFERSCRTTVTSAVAPFFKRHIFRVCYSSVRL